jgi:uncharacterized protein (TIGR03437 family)
MVSLIAGRLSGSCSSEENIPVMQSCLGDISDLYVDSSGNVDILSGGLVRQVSPDGRINSIAGKASSNVPDYGDGGPALSTRLVVPNPASITGDAYGNLYLPTIDIPGLPAYSGYFSSVDIGSLSTFSARIRKILAAPPLLSVDIDHLEFSANAGALSPGAQTVVIQTGVPSVPFEIVAPAAWLDVLPTLGRTPLLLRVTVKPSLLTPGVYGAVLTVRSELTTPTEVSIQITAHIDPAVPAAMQVEPQSLSFTLARGVAQRSQSVRVSNRGSGGFNFTVTTAVSTSITWLRATPSGSVTPDHPANVVVAADSTNLQPGTYSGSVTISTLGDSRTINVVLTISESDKAIQLSQSGFSFLSVQGGGVAPPQEFGVLNLGNTPVSWKVSTSTLSGGQQWLQIGVREGTTDAAGSTPIVSTAIDQYGLDVGRYYGLVSVDAPGAANTPQLLTVCLQVLGPDNRPPAIIRPAELLFVTPEQFPYNDGQSGSQDLLIYNLTTRDISYRSSISATFKASDFTGTTAPDNALSDVIYAPRSGIITPAEPAHIVFQPLIPERIVGTLNGVLTLQFSDGNVQQVPFTETRKPATAPTKNRLAGGCSPTRLDLAVTSLGQSFQVSAGWPVALVTEVRNDCQEPLKTGRVVATFSNGDQPVILQSLSDGRWHGTWQAGTATANGVVVKIDAEDPQSGVRGTREIDGGIASSQERPVFQAQDVVSAAGLTPFVPIAPGAEIQISGVALAEQMETSSTIPLPATLAGTSVIIGSRRAPLLSASPDQIHAIVPYDLPINTRFQMVITKGQTYSAPVSLDVAAAQPAIFLQSPSISTAGRIFTVHAGADDGATTPVTTDTPASPGDRLVIYGTGLGQVRPSIEAGDAPSPAPAVAGKLLLTIGGQPVDVTTASLVPGMAGLYQVVASLPDDVPRGNEVPVLLQIAGQGSPVVTMAIR